MAGEAPTPAPVEAPAPPATAEAGKGSGPENPAAQAQQRQEAQDTSVAGKLSDAFSEPGADAKATLQELADKGFSDDEAQSLLDSANAEGIDGQNLEHRVDGADSPSLEDSLNNFDNTDIDAEAANLSNPPVQETTAAEQAAAQEPGSEDAATGPSEEQSTEDQTTDQADQQRSWRDRFKNPFGRSSQLQPAAEANGQSSAAEAQSLSDQSGTETQTPTMSATEQQTDNKLQNAEAQAQNELTEMKAKLDKGEITDDEYRAAQTKYQEQMAELATQTGVGVAATEKDVPQDATERATVENATIHEPTAAEREAGAQVEEKSSEGGIGPESGPASESNAENQADSELTLEEQRNKELLEAGVNLAKLGVDASTPEGQRVLAEYAKNPDVCKGLVDALVAVKDVVGKDALPATAKAMQESVQQQVAEAERTGDKKKLGKLKMLLLVLGLIVAAVVAAPVAAVAVASGSISK